MTAFQRRRVVMLVAAAALGCGPVPEPGRGGVGPGHRPQALALTPDQEYRLGVEAYQQVLHEAAGNGALVRTGPAVEHVRRVGQSIADMATGESRKSQLLRREINLRTEGYRFDWEFAVIDTDQVNAFCLPGGKVAVFTGLLRVAGDRDDWLATLLGHEIAHALAHHASERIYRAEMSDRALKALLFGLGALGEQERDRLEGLLAAGTRFGSLPFDRRQESEADHIGVFLMAFAEPPYDPRAAVEFWEAMARRGGGRLPEILSDHPSDARRAAQLRAWAEQAWAAKRAFEQGRTAPG
jgi:predicted Zn-dependent protease